MGSCPQVILAVGGSFFLVLLMMNIISWNYRGAGSKTFPSIIRDLRQQYGANLFFLLETHISGTQGKQIRDKMGFDKSFVVDAVGHVGGDFNAMLHNHEKRGGARNNSQSACKEFQECVSNCGLVDLDYSGWPFTWKRGNLEERLDRGLSNLDWQIAFPEACVKHLPMLKSDHSPIYLQLSNTMIQNRGRPSFLSLLPGSPTQILEILWMSLRMFNYLGLRVFRCLRANLKIGTTQFLVTFLNGNIESLEGHRGLLLVWGILRIPFLRSCRKTCGWNMDTLLFKKKFYGSKKPGASGSSLGIKTQFFHGSTMIRRRRNKIISLQNDNGDWVTDNATLENMATTFFLNLYTDSPTHTPFILKNMFPTLSSSDNIMAQNVTDDEVKDVIFGMGSWKAPGRDGLQAIWNKVGTDVCELTRNIFQEPNKIREFARTDDLRKYIGVPILHCKVSKHTFEGIINKLHTRHNSWKAFSLSLDGRVTLVKFVLSSMPVYNMQSVVLPSATCNIVDRICRNFIWGDTKQTKKIHLLSWKKVCELKKFGSLGIRHASQMNQAFMMKAGWGLIERKDALWARVLRSKYGSGTDIIPKVERKRNNSNLWKGICSTWDKVQHNCIWRIGDGSQIRFWDHCWVPGVGRLSEIASQVSNNVNYSDMLMDFLNVSGHWDIEKL
ncbi:uncharacterized protein [Arachis hypogaea]|uniref:uncharacterized protein n=1 Tax=Arachis hypogaea TaxID=3818 RepID=UPI003B20F3FC